MTTKKPLETLRDGNLVATIWPLDEGPDVQCYTTLFKRRWTADGEEVSYNFRGDELVRIAALALQAYSRERSLCDDREDFGLGDWE